MTSNTTKSLIEQVQALKNSGKLKHGSKTSNEQLFQAVKALVEQTTIHDGVLTQFVESVTKAANTQPSIQAIIKSETVEHFAAEHNALSTAIHELVTITLFSLLEENK